MSSESAKSDAEPAAQSGDGSCWLQFSCFRCGSAYRSRIEGAGQTASTARLLETWERRDQRCAPCPACGLVQPAQAFHDKYVWQSLAALAAVLIVVPILVLRFFNVILSVDAAAVLGAVVAAGLAFVHLKASLFDANRDRAANRERAAAEVAADKLVLDAPASDRGHGFVPRNLTPIHLGALGAVVAAGPFFLMPLAISIGAPHNPDCTPAVVGPGDRVMVRFSRISVESLLGYWSTSTGSAELVEPRLNEVAQPAVPIPGRGNMPLAFHFGQPKIHVNPKDKLRVQTPKAHALIAIPDNASLSGQTVKFRVRAQLTYPVQDGKSEYTIKHTDLEETFTLRLSAPHAGANFSQLATIGLLLGSFGSVLGSLVLAFLTRNQRALGEPGRLV